ncbi:MAG: formate dehydrogenase accessory sulfurtransferase FdhD [Limnochordia bacterium]|jgi:FdhD protein|nr:formate dehydrogenase accessory sulfurtransferase FdhD [Limnochordia bacterium]MDI9466237.1 formate dehydrogenase accessory sulfurtransferase FdhD [Bacillota bacterium]NLO95468.1 formate dehydrogenase accessory sulfurtransferase FdhD [Bacillota bacterium]HAI52787.1 hypothetical protein [Bacillota bacterium]HAN95326.1 hypothetical protein [Bacillota bacterium]
MEVVKQVEITRIEGGCLHTVQDALVIDHQLKVYVNGRLSVEFLCLPANLEELVCGHLFALGVIGSTADLEQLTISGSAAHVELRRGAAGRAPQQKSFFLQVQDLFQAMDWFAGRSELFAATGAVHSCALWHQDGRRIFMEDIGRHNAVDKALGRALLADWDLAQCALLTSGRVPGDLVEKALHTGVQVIVSRSAPLASAVALARQYGITLCGFARGQRINIYSGSERIVA